MKKLWEKFLNWIDRDARRSLLATAMFERAARDNWQRRAIIAERRWEAHMMVCPHAETFGVISKGLEMKVHRRRVGGCYSPFGNSNAVSNIPKGN